MFGVLLNGMQAQRPHKSWNSPHLNRFSSPLPLVSSSRAKSVRGYLSPPHAPVSCSVGAGRRTAGDALLSWLLFLSLRVAIVSGR